MLKGLKLKSKLPDKNTDSSNQAPQSTRIEEEAPPTSVNKEKRWLKTSDDLPPQKKIVLEEHTIKEDDLVQACENIWKNFLQGETNQTESLLRDLKRKEKKFYDSFKPAVVNQNILEEEDPEAEIFASIEKTALRNFDPKKSAYIVTDIMADHVRSKGKSDVGDVYKMYTKKATGKTVESLYDEEYDTKEFEEKDENKRKTKKDRKIEEKAIQKEKAQTNRIQRILGDCRFCLANNRIVEEQILSFSPNILLIIPENKQYSTKIEQYKSYHFYLLPVEHVVSEVEMEEDQYDELKNYMKCLTSMYDKMNYGVAFLETYINIDKSPHSIIEVIAMPRKYHEELPLYFKKALNELESEWATHKKIIDIKKEKGGIRKQIPKNFPYFFIDFDTTYGYAHVIEKTKEYNRNFAHEIIGSILKIDKSMTMFPKKYSRDELLDIKDEFLDKWVDFDWTKIM